MCIRVLWADSGQGPLVGRNMDWATEMDTQLWVMPRGVAKVAGTDDPNPLRWRAQYGSVVATAWGTAVSDGINERGLGAHILWLAESDYGPRDARLRALSAASWAQFALDRFATVADFLAAMDDEPFQVRALTERHSGKSSTVHLAIEDATGASAVIEYLDGAAVVHHGADSRVATNSPPYDQQLERLRGYQGFGGELPLPGTTDPADRFVRASYYTARLPKAEDPERAYAALLSVMRNAAQPFGTADPERPNVSATLWRTLADLERGVYAFESSVRPDLVWAHLDRMDLERYQRLDLSGPGLYGDVSGRFTPAEPLAFPAFES